MSTRHAQIVIIGGGAIGCSIAYHLGKLGRRDVLLLEQSGLTHGATWHAAGLVGQLRGKRNLTRLMQYGAQLFGQLAAETGHDPDWRPVGSLRIAASDARWQEIRRTATTARSFGFELELIGPHDARERFPLLEPREVRGAAWVPGDGYIDPSGLTQAYARGARAAGITLVEGERVQAILHDGRRVHGVRTDAGEVHCEVLVNAAGLWAREVAALAGVRLATGVVEHQYMITGKSPRIGPDLPTYRDPDALCYLKPDAGALALGGWEANTVPFALDGMPPGFGRELLESKLERFAPLAEQAARRLPLLYELGVQRLINGPIPVSADGEPIMGPVPGFENFFVACGFTAGIAASGGAGKTLAEWIVGGEPELDVWTFDSRRFGPHHATRAFLAARTVESYARYYLMHWPGEEMQSARRLRSSPLYDILRDRGAVFGSRFGWERANWFARAGEAPRDTHAFDRRETSWFSAVAAEHRAVRERVALIDQSSFAKLEIRGSGALAALQRLAAADIDRPVGSVIYTPLCNARGGIECDLTIMRTDEARFHVVTGSGFGVHDFDWIARHLPRDGSVAAREVTSGLAVLNLCGPHARDVLATVSPDALDDAAFPFATCRIIEVGAARALAARIGYTGELGWELYLPAEMAVHAYRCLLEAGAGFGLVDAGYRAIDSLRMEKGYRYWSADITPDHDPFAAGLGARVHFARKGDFLGREALERIHERGPAQRLCTFTIDGPPVFYGAESILHDGRVVATTTSANFGHTLATNIAYGYLPATLCTESAFEVEAFGERYPARRHDQPLYDPQMLRLKC